MREEIAIEQKEGRTDKLI